MQKKKEIGNIFFRKGNFEKAIAQYLQVIAMKNEQNSEIILSQTFSNLAACYLKLGKKEKALEMIDNSIQLDSHYTKAKLRKCKILLEMGKIQDALFEYQKLEKELKNGKESAAFKELANLAINFLEKQMETIKINEQERIIEGKSLELMKNEMEMFFAHHYYHKKKYLVAMRHFRTCKEDFLYQNPNYLCDKIECGIELFKRTKKKAFLLSSMKEITKGLLTSSKYPRLYYLRGLSYYLQKKIPQSNRNLEFCIYYLKKKMEDPILYEKAEKLLLLTRKKLEKLPNLTLPKKKRIEQIRKDKNIVEKLKDPKIQSILNEIEKDPKKMKIIFLEHPEIYDLVCSILEKVDKNLLSSLKKEQEDIM